MRWLVVPILTTLILLAPVGRAVWARAAAPRPVILIHGFASSPAAWSAYTRAEGYLASIGRRGFAVGDGQAPGLLRMGDPLDPGQPTSTVLENASALRDYIAGVRRLTGADQVDLLAHSMGGLVARAYIDRFMPRGEVAQLIMLGTPNAGTGCAQLPSAAGLYLPAALELRPSYVESVFNAQIRAQHGVPFFLVAGIGVGAPLGSPCAEAPSDLIVARVSVAAISGQVTEVTALHTDLIVSDDVFQKVVRALLLAQTPATLTEQLPAAEPVEPLDFTRVFPGRVAPGEQHQELVQIDEVAVASFALFDPTRSLTLEVRGVSGAVLLLSADANALRQVDDPASLVRIGYGVDHPRPGPWRITVSATPRTPPDGAPYALSARVRGGAHLRATTSASVVTIGNSVKLAANLQLGNESLNLSGATVWLRGDKNTSDMLPVSVQHDSIESEWRPEAAGVYGLDLLVEGVLPDGTPLERSAFLSVEAVQADVAPLRAVTAGLYVVSLALASWAGLVGWRSWRRKASATQ
ncbi:MAG: esterase/lipase family protein [Chloroflexota bacterium]